MHDELMLDANPRLDLATFVTTRTEPRNIPQVADALRASERASADI